jgi:hypothetical protein
MLQQTLDGIQISRLTRDMNRRLSFLVLMVRIGFEIAKNNAHDMLSALRRMMKRNSTIRIGKIE